MNCLIITLEKFKDFHILLLHLASKGKFRGNFKHAHQQTKTGIKYVIWSSNALKLNLTISLTARENEFGSRLPCYIGVWLYRDIDSTIGKLSLASMARYTYKWRFSCLFREARQSYSDWSRYNRLRIRDPCSFACSYS